ncbi:MAG: TonB-dependent receptor [Bacteroidales bacterium]
MKRLILINILATISILSLSLNNVQAQEQNGTLKGFVYDKKTGEPIIYTNVYFKGTSKGASTDVNGFFSITQIKPGKYTLLITAMGYDSLKMPITIKEDQTIKKELYVTPGAQKLEGVNISGERQAARKETQTSIVKIEPQEMSKIPAVGGEADIAQYLQVLPGVIFTGDQGGQLYIRGGSPVQNKVLMDGMVVYNPFHSIGLFSVFDTDIIRHADVHTGGFSAKYGGRISSVMDITTRDGNKRKSNVKLSVSPFQSKALFEGPIKKQTDSTASSSSFIISAKHSLLEQSSKVFYDYVDQDGLPFNYTDIYGKFSVNGQDGSKINFFGFNFSDNVLYQNVSEYDWTNTGAGTNFVVVPENSNVLMEGNFAYSKYEITQKIPGQNPRKSAIDGFNLGLNFTYFMGDNQLKYGMAMQGFKTALEFSNSINRKIEQVENTTELSGFFLYKMMFGDLILEPSFRAHYYASLSEFSPEPRFAAKYNVNDFLRLKLAGGLYSQNLISTKYDRDVVNLFYGFVSGPDNLPSKYKGEEVTSKLQKAQHIVTGAEIDIMDNITINLEAYYKNFSQLSNLNRNKIFNDSQEYIDKPDYLKKDFIIESGHAKGIDFTIKYNDLRLYLWGVYSLGYVEKTDNFITYNPHYDRRHNINLVGSYKLGKNLDWEVNARWNLGSGFPFTPSAGYYPKQIFDGGIGSDYTDANGEFTIYYGETNSKRFPTYHRLDLGVTRKFYPSTSSTLEVKASITNAYNRKNIFYIDRVSGDRVNQLPVMPSLGVSLEF